MMARAPQRTPSGDLELQEDESVGLRVPGASLIIRGKDAGEATSAANSFRRPSAREPFVHGYW